LVLEATEEELRRVSDTSLPWEILHLAQLALEAYCLLELTVEQRLRTAQKGIAATPNGTPGLTLSSETVKNAAILSKVQKRMRNITNTARASLLRIADDLAKRANKLKSERGTRASRLAATELPSVSRVNAPSLSGTFVNGH
jgi:hypothetical protein